MYRLSSTQTLSTGSYDPATNSWHLVPEAPIEPTDATAVWTGREMTVFGATLYGGNFPETETETAIGAAYDPVTDTWRRIANSNLSPQAFTDSWNGTEMIPWDYLNDAAARSFTIEITSQIESTPVIC